MQIEYDPAKRAKTLNHRGLDFERSLEAFNAPHIDIPDTRFEYGEKRIISIGFLDGREIVIVWTQRGDKRRIISMRKANGRERQAFYQHMDRS